MDRKKRHSDLNSKVEAVHQKHTELRQNFKNSDAGERYSAFFKQSIEGKYRIEMKEPVDVRLPIEAFIDRMYEEAFIAECNSSFLDMYDFKSEAEIHNRTLVELHGGKNNPVNREANRRFIRSGFRLVNQETQERTQKGKTVWFLNNAVGIVEDLHLVRIWGTQLDITQRKQAEMQLKREKERAEESESRYRALHNASFGGIAIHDKGIILDCNKGLSEISGFTHEELIGMNGLQLIDEDYRKIVLGHISAAYEKPYEVIGLKKNGDRYPLQLEAREIPYQGKAVRVVEFRNISDLKASERALRESEEKYRLLADNLSDVIWTRDLEFNLTYISPSIEKQSGFSPQERLEQPIQKIMTDDSELRLMTLVQKELLVAQRADADRKRSSIVELEMIRKDGEVYPVESTFSFIRNEKGLVCGLIGINRDISDRKRAEAEKAVLESQLQQAQKMEAIGTLAGGIAHDFNNMLSVIIGNAELVRKSSVLGEQKLLHRVDRILKASDRARGMIQQILAFSRKSKPQLEAVNIVETILETIDFLRSSISTSIEIQQELPGSIGLVWGNATQINQVLMNLCTNAAHAMKEKGGILSIGLKRVCLNRKKGASMDLAPGPYFKLTVRDTGCGIPDKIASRIFDPYFTTKKAEEGTGMGLAVTYGVMKTHQGTITVDSIKGKGTVFTAYFPELDRKVAQAQLSAEKEIPRGNGESILFIDDDPVLTELGHDMLTDLGYQVTEINDSQEALSILQLHPERFKLVISDQNMPGLTGTRLVKALRQSNIEIPVLLCTGFSDVINENNFSEFGLSGFLMKPIDRMGLGKMVFSVLAGRRNPV